MRERVGLNPDRPPVPRVATTAVPESPALDGEPNGFDRNQSKPAAADDPARYRSHLVPPKRRPAEPPREATGGKVTTSPRDAGQDHSPRAGAGERN
jgi:hypothetical protein